MDGKGHKTIEEIGNVWLPSRGYTTKHGYVHFQQDYSSVCSSAALEAINMNIDGLHEVILRGASFNEAVA